MSKDCTIYMFFIVFYSSFESTEQYFLLSQRAAYHMMDMKTGAFGVNVSVCGTCAAWISVHYNS